MTTSYHRFGNTDALTLREILYRAKNPAFVGSVILRRLLELYNQFSPSEFARLYRRVSDITMCSPARLRGLHHAAKYVIAQKIPGDMVECGCARGGSAVRKVNCQR